MKGTAMRRRWIFALLALLVPVAVFGATGDYGWPSAGRVGASYEPDKQTAGFRTALASADSTFTTAGILATTEFQVLGRQNISVGARFSAPGQTCVVQVVYVYNTSTDGKGSSTSNINTIKGWSSKVTLTGGTTLKEGTYYEAPDFVFDGAGSVTCRVLLITAPSSGTVSLWVGSY